MRNIISRPLCHDSYPLHLNRCIHSSVVPLYEPMSLPTIDTIIGRLSIEPILANSRQNLHPDEIIYPASSNNAPAYRHMQPVRQLCIDLPSSSRWNQWCDDKINIGASEEESDRP